MRDLWVCFQEGSLEAAFDVKTHIKCMKIKTESGIQREWSMGCVGAGLCQLS